MIISQSNVAIFIVSNRNVDTFELPADAGGLASRFAETFDTSMDAVVATLR